MIEHFVPVIGKQIILLQIFATLLRFNYSVIVYFLLLEQFAFQMHHWLCEQIKHKTIGLDLLSRSFVLVEILSSCV